MGRSWRSRLMQTSPSRRAVASVGLRPSSANLLRVWRDIKSLGAAVGRSRRRWQTWWHVVGEVGEVGSLPFCMMGVLRSCKDPLLTECHSKAFSLICDNHRRHHAERWIEVAQQRCDCGCRRDSSFWRGFRRYLTELRDTGLVRPVCDADLDAQSNTTAATLPCRGASRIAATTSLKHCRVCRGDQAAGRRRGACSARERGILQGSD